MAISKKLLGAKEIEMVRIANSLKPVEWKLLHILCMLNSNLKLTAKLLGVSRQYIRKVCLRLETSIPSEGAFMPNGEEDLHLVVEEILNLLEPLRFHVREQQGLPPLTREDIDAKMIAKKNVSEKPLPSKRQILEEARKFFFPSREKAQVSRRINRLRKTKSQDKRWVDQKKAADEWDEIPPQ